MCEAVCPVRKPLLCVSVCHSCAQLVRNMSDLSAHMSVTPSMADQAFCRQL